MTTTAHSRPDAEVYDFSSPVSRVVSSITTENNLHELVQLENGSYGHLSYAASAFFESDSAVELFAAVNEERGFLGLDLSDTELARLYAPLFDLMGKQ